MQARLLWLAVLKSPLPAQEGSTDFPDFVGSVLNDLYYLLDDSLARLQVGACPRPVITM